MGEVVDITGHASPDMLFIYRREAQHTTATAINKMLTTIQDT